MTVKKKLSPSIDKFIDKGADVKSKKNKIFKNVLVRINSTLLNEVDEEIDNRSWLTRTQWIVEAIHEKLTKERK